MTQFDDFTHLACMPSVLFKALNIIIVALNEGLRYYLNLFLWLLTEHYDYQTIHVELNHNT